RTGDSSPKAATKAQQQRSGAKKRFVNCNSSRIWSRARFCSRKRELGERRGGGKEKRRRGRWRKRLDRNAQVQEGLARQGDARKRSGSNKKHGCRKVRGAYNSTGKKNIMESKRAKLWVADY